MLRYFSVLPFLVLLANPTQAENPKADIQIIFDTSSFPIGYEAMPLVQQVIDSGNESVVWSPAIIDIEKLEDCQTQIRIEFVVPDMMDISYAPTEYVLAYERLIQNAQEFNAERRRIAESYLDEIIEISCDFDLNSVQIELDNLLSQGIGSFGGISEFVRFELEE